MQKSSLFSEGNDLFFSEFDLNAEKYGYVRGASNEKLTKYPNIENRALPWQRSDKMVDRKGGWYNEHWSMASAQLFAIMWKRRIAKNSADKLSQTHRTGNTSMSLLNSDYTWKEIMTPRKDKEKEFLLLILVQEILFSLCGLSIHFYKRLSELLKHGVSNIKQWDLHGQKQIKNR